MKLLFDQNLSFKLVNIVEKFFHSSNHVRLLGLDRSLDTEVWQYAKEHNFIIVTQDSDFYELSLIFGFPPKVICLTCGNTSTQNISDIILKNIASIGTFAEDKELGCLEIY